MDERKQVGSINLITQQIPQNYTHIVSRFLERVILPFLPRTWGKKFLSVFLLEECHLYKEPNILQIRYKCVQFNVSRSVK